MHPQATNMLLLAGAVLATATLVTPLEAAEDPAQCAPVTGRVAYRGLGYDHIVEVHNGCLKRVRCEVWTDVDPKPRYTLHVDPGQTGDVVTRRGSPASAFQAQGACTF